VEYPRVTPRRPADRKDRGVYVELDELVRLQYRARGFSFLPRQPVHSVLAGRYGSRVRGRGLDFEELRAYLPGDDVRSIDWRVTARTGKPYVRVFNEERDRATILLVDQRISMFYGTRLNLKSVTAAEAAALAAWRVLDRGDRVGAVVFNDGEMVTVRPRRSRGTVVQILEAVVRMNRALRAGAGISPEPGMLDRALEAAARLARHDILLVIISDFDGAGEATRRRLIRLLRHNDAIGALVHDPSATGLPPAESFVVSNGELQLELDLSRPAERRKVAAFAGERIAKLLDWQRSPGLPMMPLSCAEDTGRQIRHFLGARGPAASLPRGGGRPR